MGTSVILALSSCSLFGGSSSTSLNLQSANSKGWREVQSSPYVYEIATDDSGKTFMTAIKECEKKKTISPQVASRQLFVGLKEIKIQSQDAFNIENLPALRSHVTARFEDRPIDLLAFTVPHKLCVYDFVLWHTANADGTSDPSKLLDNSDMFSQFLSKNLAMVLE